MAPDRILSICVMCRTGSSVMASVSTLDVLESVLQWTESISDIAHHEYRAMQEQNLSREAVR